MLNACKTTLIVCSVELNAPLVWKQWCFIILTKRQRLTCKAVLRKYSDSFSMKTRLSCCCTDIEYVDLREVAGQVVTVSPESYGWRWEVLWRLVRISHNVLVTDDKVCLCIWQVGKYICLTFVMAGTWGRENVLSPFVLGWNIIILHLCGQLLQLWFQCEWSFLDLIFTYNNKKLLVWVLLYLVPNKHVL